MAAVEVIDLRKEFVRKDGRKRDLDLDKAADAVLETILEERR